MAADTVHSAGSVAARLIERFGTAATVEARYQLALAEERFRLSLLRAGKDLSAIEHWVDVSNLLDELCPNVEPDASR